MSRAYVAGRTDNIENVQRVQAIMQAWGWRITHDWTRIVQEVGGAANEHGVPPKKQAEFAFADMMGVESAHLVVVVGSPGLCGTLIEMGMALAWGTPVWTLGTFERESVFFHLSQVTRIPDLDGLWGQLQSVGPRGRVLTPPIRTPAFGLEA